VPPLALVDVHLSPIAILAQRFCKLVGGSARVLVRDGAAAAAQFFIAQFFIFYLCFFVLQLEFLVFVSCSFNKVK